VARRPLEREQISLDGGRRTTQLMRDSLGSNGYNMLLLTAELPPIRTTFSHTELVLIGAELVLVLYGFRLYFLMTRALRAKHPDIWRQLGSPSLSTSNSPSTTSKVTGFVFSGSYRELNDDQINTLAGRWRAVNVLFICGIAALIYQFLRYGP